MINTSFQQFFILHCPESNLKYCFPLYIMTETEKKSIAAFCYGKISTIRPNYRQVVFSRVLRNSTPRFVGPSVGLSVGPSVGLSVGPSIHPSIGPSIRHTLLFLGFCGLWPHCSCASNQVTSIRDLAHPHATWVAMYPQCLMIKANYFPDCAENALTDSRVAS